MTQGRSTYLTLSQESKELATGHVVHHKVHVVGILECAPQVDNEWMHYLDQDRSFGPYVLDLFLLDDGSLPDHFECAILAVGRFACKVDAAE